MSNANSSLFRRPAATVLSWAIWVAAAVLGGIGIWQRVMHGNHASGLSSYVPWGLWVAAYTYFSGLTAGLFLLAAAAYVLKVRWLLPTARLLLLSAAVALLMGLLAIAFDLGHMERAIYVFTRPQFHSMMAWMVWMYTAYAILLVAMLMVSRKQGPLTGDSAMPSPALRVLSLIGLPLVIAFAGGVGALFGTVEAREYWHQSLYPIFFLVGALTSGAALLTAMVAWFWSGRGPRWRDLVARLGRLVLALILVEFVLEWAEFSVPAWYQIGSVYALIKYVLFGPYWYVFWIVHFLLGVVVPVLLLSLSRRPRLIGLAAALAAVTFFAVRLNLVIPGLISPEIAGLGRSYGDPVGHRLTFQYLPTFFEWQVLLGVLAVGAAVFYIGARLLRLTTPSDFSNEVL